MGRILHDWGLEKKRMLIRKTYEALPRGGAFIAYDSTEYFIRSGPSREPGSRHPPVGADFNRLSSRQGQPDALAPAHPRAAGARSPPDVR